MSTESKTRPSSVAERKAFFENPKAVESGGSGPTVLSPTGPPPAKPPRSHESIRESKNSPIPAARQQNDAATAKTAINILLVGETGVGKSTFINAFSIYLQYGSLAQAEAAPAEQLFHIPMQFSDTDPETYDERKIRVGENHDVNEWYDVVGDSVTQDPMIHTQQLPGVTINFIDTPGVGDTSGVEKDKENVQKILTCLTHFEHLDAICLLLRPNQSRLEARFKYCLTEILRNLHESAIRNIVICFTNGQAVNYKPGETVSLLKAFMSGDEVLKQIEISDRTTYFVENQSVKLLAKLKSSGKLDPTERQSADGSWAESMVQMYAMLNHINRLPRHLVIGMTSINDARRIIAIATELLLDIAKCLVNSVKSIDYQSKKIQERKEQIEREPEKHAYDLQDQLYEEEYEIKVTKLKHAMTVCASAACSECINGQYNLYRQVCDEKCTWAASLRLCVAMNPITGICKKCKCHYREHRWQTSKTDIEKKRIVSQAVIDKIVRKDLALSILHGHLKLLQSRREKNITEKAQILEPCAKLSTFLQQNTLLKSDETNDFLYYLNQRATAMKRQKSPDAETQMALAELEQLELEYKEKLSDIHQLKEVYSTASVKVIIEELYALPLKGEELRRAVGIVESSRSDAVNNNSAAKICFISQLQETFAGLFPRKK